MHERQYGRECRKYEQSGEREESGESASHLDRVEGFRGTRNCTVPERTLDCPGMRRVPGAVAGAAARHRLRFGSRLAWVAG